MIWGVKTPLFLVQHQFITHIKPACKRYDRSPSSLDSQLSIFSPFGGLNLQYLVYNLLETPIWVKTPIFGNTHISFRGSTYKRIKNVDMSWLDQFLLAIALVCSTGIGIVNFLRGFIQLYISQTSTRSTHSTQWG